MKKYLFLLLALFNLLIACDKNKEEEIIFPNETKAFINKKVFTPSKSVAIKAGNRYLVSFLNEKQKIEIITNDTVSGIYKISPDILNTSDLLSASFTYTKDNTKFIGTTGEIEILKDISGAVAGKYKATVSDNANTIDIDSGSFTVIHPKTASALLENETAILETLDGCYSDLYKYIEFTYVFDGVYSNNTSLPGASWTEVYQHKQTQSSENQKIFTLWNDALNLIYKINLTIRSADLFLTESNTKSLIMAQAKAMRSYLLYNLMTWFGEVPVEKEFYNGMNPRSTIPQVINQIVNDATEAMNSLPEIWSGGDSYRIPKYLMFGIMARVYLTDFSQQNTYPTLEPYLYGNNYIESISVSQLIINSGLYNLKNTSSNFTASDKEIIWGFNKDNNTEFNQVFNKGSYLPLIRLTEIYLILAEAMIKNNNSDGALALINQLNKSRGYPIVSSVTAEDIYTLWNTEMKLEGSIYLVMKRFNKAITILQNDFNKILLPVPLSALIENPNLTQNIGY